MNDLERSFAPGGTLERAIPGYRHRPQQVEFANAVLQAIKGHGVLIAEAGTGTGKTFAYLVPALLEGGRVIVSTGTKTLQDQLFHRDLPLVRKALGVSADVALLKGRANYVCLHHLEAAVELGSFAAREEAAHIHRIRSFSKATITGDKSECADVPESSGAWSQATSTRENCLGSACKHYQECFVMKARKRASEADVVVVNHHLFFADVVLRDEGAADLLPAANTVIFDEAHHLPDLARLFFGQSVSTAQAVEYFIENLGAITAPILTGIIADAFNLQTAILLICTIAWGLCFLFYLGAIFTIDKDTQHLRSQMAERAKSM